MCLSALDLKSIINLPKTVIESANLTNRNISFAGSPFEQQLLQLFVRPDARWQHRCPYCMQHRSVYDHQSGLVSWRAPNFNGTIITLNYEPARIVCPEHGIIREYIPWAVNNCRFTRDFIFNIAWMSLQLSKSAISSYFQIGWPTVGHCIKAAHDLLEPDPSLRLLGLKKFCIDETSYAKGHKYITVVYDMEKLQVVWVHDGHGLEVFELFANALTPEQRSEVEVVAGDGARWIDSGTSMFFPNASRCIDIFHLVGWCNEALDEVRKDVMQDASSEYQKTEKAFLDTLDLTSNAIQQAEKELVEAASNLDKERMNVLEAYIKLLKSYNNPDIKPSKKSKLKKKFIKFLSPDQLEVLAQLKKLSKTLKNARYAVTKNPENRTACQNDKIDLIASSAPILYLAYLLKEALRSIVHMEHVDGAAHELDRWIDKALNSGIAPFVALAEKISRHRENLLNSIRFKANSSQSESCNALIKSVIRTAKGFRNLNNLFAMIYLKCSTLVIPLTNRPQYTPEQKAELHQKAKEYRQKMAQKNKVA